MTPTEVITILQAYSNWRKGGDGWPPSPNQTIKAINAAEKDTALKERIIDSRGSTLNAVANERDALRTELADLRSSMTFRTSLIGRIEAERDALQAKVEAMERQEPVASVWRCDNGHIHGSCERTLPMGTKLYPAPGAQPAPSFADAYQGARECVAIWKKWALEAEDLNRKFIAEINGPTYMGEPAQPAPMAVAYLDIGAGGYMDIGTDLTDEALAALPKGRHMLGIIGTYGVDGYVLAQPAPSIQEEEKERLLALAHDQNRELIRLREECRALRAKP